MANHVLSLEVPTVMNSCIMKLFDTSVYTTLLPVTCPTLNITVPGFGYSVQLNTTENFAETITACDLQLQTVDCGTVNYDIPDGIYIIKYSVEPKNLVYVEYNHLRITTALNRVRAIYCELDLGACEPPTNIMNKLNQLRLVEQYLSAAKAYVEDCHNPKKGMELYTYAMKQLDKLSCGTSCGTC